MRRFHSLRVCPTIHPMVPVANNSWMKVVSVVTGMAACACFYCALMTLLMIPVYPGDAYLNKFRLLYGAVPALLSVALPAIAGWLWSRSGGPASIETYVQRAFLAMFAGVALFFLCLIVVGHLKGWMP
jgi:hypothetical protein